MKFTIALTAALTSLQVVSAQNAATAKRAVDVSRAEEGQIFERQHCVPLWSYCCNWAGCEYCCGVSYCSLTIDAAQGHCHPLPIREIPANEENESTEEDQGSDGTETAEEN